MSDTKAVLLTALASSDNISAPSSMMLSIWPVEKKTGLVADSFRASNILCLSSDRFIIPCLFSHLFGYSYGIDLPIHCDVLTKYGGIYQKWIFLFAYFWPTSFFKIVP